MKTQRALLLLLLASLIFLSGCLYRMPDEDEFSLIPNTNNPDLVREQPGGWMPSVQY